MSTLGEDFERARQLHQQGLAARAIPLYRRVLHEDAFNSDAHFLLGKALADSGQPREARSSWEQVLRLRPDYAEAHLQLGILAAQGGDNAQALTCFRRAVQHSPEFAEAHHNLAVALAVLKHSADAEQHFRHALHLRPNYAEAYHNLARFLEEHGRTPEAIDCYRALIQIQPEHVDGRNHLGILLARLGEYAEAVTCFKEVLRREPQRAGAHHNLAVAAAEQGDYETALGHFQTTLQLAPDHAEAHKGLGLLRLQAGQLEEGWLEYEWRWRCKDFIPRQFPQPPWDGGAVTGKTILLLTEQGFGDTFQFVRYAAMVKERGARVLLECQPALGPLLATCPGLDAVVPKADRLPPFDAYAWLLSLPGIVGTTLPTIPAPIPYLKADPARAERWQREFAAVDALKIGITWQGNPDNPWDRRRSIPLACFERLAAVPGVHLFAIQKGKGLEQLPDIVGHFPVSDLSTRLATFSDTAAAIANLDLVICCDTAVAHLAGALGVPTWVALSAVPDWRWLLEREDSPWYPNLRLFRQSVPGNWADVFERMSSELRASKRPLRP